MLLRGPHLTFKRSQLAPRQQPLLLKHLRQLPRAGIFRKKNKKKHWQKKFIKKDWRIKKDFHNKCPLKGQVLCHMTRRAPPIISALAPACTGTVPAQPSSRGWVPAGTQRAPQKTSQLKAALLLRAGAGEQWLFAAQSGEQRALPPTRTPNHPRPGAARLPRGRKQMG